jgi:hypothetical protein
MHAVSAIYADNVGTYLARGWADTLPLAPFTKDPPITGFTGYDAAAPTERQIELWKQNNADWNLSIRMPSGVVGFDVDAYDGKAGAETLIGLEDRLGPLPDTYSSGSRGFTTSRIRFYVIPHGVRLHDHPGGQEGGIELIQRHHRYAVAWPSIHPERRMYRWYDMAGEDMDGPPDVGDLTPLPTLWVDHLRVKFDSNHANAATADDVRAFFDEHSTATHPRWLDGIRNKLKDTDGSRHDHLVATSCWAMREAAAGLYSARDAVYELAVWWKRVMDDPRRRDGSEFADAIAWAVAQVRANPDEVAAVKAKAAERIPTIPEFVTPADESDSGTYVDNEQPTLPDAFWEARPALEHIRTAAHSRQLSPDGVLGAVMARVVALTDHRFVLPDVVGRYGSLNINVALPAPSGQGKGSSLDTAADLVPADGLTRFRQAPAGSGEGTVKAFFDKVTVLDPETNKTSRNWDRVVDSLLLRVDEGTLVRSLAQRTGQTTLETWRSAWSGEELGGTYADPDRRGFILGAHDYRLCIVMGVQPTLAQFMFDDTDAGTPQRFLWLGLIHPRLPEPDHLPDWPGPLVWPRPMWGVNGIVAVAGRDCGVFTIDADIVRDIRMQRHRVATGTVRLSPLDGHENLSRLKVAAVFAVLDGRVHISTDDWKLAGILQDTSNAVRSWTRRMIAGKEAAAEKVGLERVARRAAAQEAGKTSGAAAVERIARLLARHVAEAGGEGIKRTDLYRKLASRDRRGEFFEAAIAHGIDHRWIAEHEGRLIPGRDVDGVAA